MNQYQSHLRVLKGRVTHLRWGRTIRYQSHLRVLKVLDVVDVDRDVDKYQSHLRVLKVKNNHPTVKPIALVSIAPSGIERMVMR
ncbi:hypothetical protein GK108_13535 [Spirosoma terrae]|uniref:Uncharacterized protein n=1 Tax=Spirosoma terrae TaxID=1968276 RepID=A0A6L9L672_9BACT|nr:hypothetical protein [Spirosoma terrae]